MPELTALQPPLHGPLAVRSEYVTAKETVVYITELDRSVLTRDFVMTNDTGSTILQVTGKTICKDMLREFEDGDGLPLLELRRRAGTWAATLPGAGLGDNIASIAFKAFFIHTKFQVVFNNLMPPSAGETHDYRDVVLLDVKGLDSSNERVQVACGGSAVMHIRRTVDQHGSRSAYKHAYGYRTRWEVTLSEGMDMSLAAMIIVVLAEQRG
ncbi:hypothetical protein LTR78_006587 [Recurvomyces mirabilis]|uniref:Uncharacterized protein n=1 Tax=Recurvomyces mirabilis TaxID=574656 RepID=A0AAE0WL15_9PEZI|nr:hypothetical protein LTR78_006587 [Recurvomyces mirabilis]KAK5154683.1 hypothetical protein LTS14_006262 [Recurvomyces mirabilis]